MNKSPSGFSNRVELGVVLLLLVGHAAVAADAAITHNVTIDEPSHLLSGLLLWERGDVRYNYLNPPLVKLLQAAPLLPLGLELPEQPGPSVPDHWADLAYALVENNRDDLFAFLPLARLINIVFGLGTGVLLYRWARQLFGRSSGIIALALWSICPNVIAWEGVCTADAVTPFFALGFLLTLRRYLHTVSVASAFWLGIVLGLAELTRFSLLILYPVSATMWALTWWAMRGSPSERPRLWHLLSALVLSFVVINVGYGLQGTCDRAGDFLFQSRWLTGGDGGGNRFRGTWLEQVPIPLPKAYILGIDTQRSYSERSFDNYLCGEWRHGGWWYYYFVAGAIKVPLGTWLLAGMAITLLLLSWRYRGGWQDELVLFLPTLVLIVMLSVHTGVNGHFRYVLPVFPLVFISISRIGRVVESTREPCRDVPRLRYVGMARIAGGLAIVTCLVWNGSALVRVHPHHLAYFNELAGGPDNGWKWVVESNLDWGQDLFALKKWLNGKPSANRELRIAYYGTIPPSMVGILASTIQWQEGPRPGWYAVSANAVAGMGFYHPGPQWRNQYTPVGAYRYFQEFDPVAKAGYSIFIYYVTLEQANAARARLGLSALP